MMRRPTAQIDFLSFRIRSIRLPARMKLSRLIIWTLLPVSCIGARKSSDGGFETYHAHSQSSAPLRLDDASYDQLTATPRNYSVVILLTALEARFGCQLCRDFQPEWDLLGKSWAKGDKHGESRILLGTLDFADGKGTFQKVVLSRAKWKCWQRLDKTDIYALAHATNGSDLPLVSTNNRSKC